MRGARATDIFLLLAFLSYTDFNFSLGHVCARACARGTNLIYDSTILMKKRLFPPSPPMGLQRNVMPHLLLLTIMY